MDDYSNHPKSIAEVTAEKSRHSKDWTPRDALIKALRAIDSGEAAFDSIVIIGRENGGTRYIVSSPDIETTLGMLAAASYSVFIDGDDD